MSEHAAPNDNKMLSSLKDWFIVLLIAGAILVYGTIVYVSIGDRGPAKWNYGAIKDVPGQSPHSTQTYSTEYLKK
jgi:hypothetical protein